MLLRSATADGALGIDLSIVVPVYRSADCLRALYASIDRALLAAGIEYELILVNDGSPDESWQVVESLCCKHPSVVGVDLRKNFGQDNAILTGIRIARARAIAVMDDDLQHDPRDLPSLLAKLEEGADVVYADFRLKHHAGWKNLGSWFNGKVAEWVLDKPPGVYLSPYKVIRREVAELVCRYDGPEPYLDGLLFQVTSRFDSLPVEHRPRYAGRGNYDLRRSIALWSRLATNFSVRPLRIVTWFGVILGALAGLLALAVIAYRIVFPDDMESATARWALLMVTELFTSAIRMIFLGVLGEYVGRTHTAVAGKKPQATVREVLNAAVPLEAFNPTEPGVVPRMR